MSQVITPELRRWVQAQLDGGESPERLRLALAQSGWVDAVCRQVVQLVQQERPLAMAPAAPGRLPCVAADPARCEVRLPDRTVRVVARLNPPTVVLLADVLSDEECEALIAAARPRLARSLTVQTATGGEERNPDRTSDGMFFNRGESPLVQRIEARIAALLNWPVENGEGMQVLHYRPGAEYKPHYDYFDPAEPGTPTLLRRGGQRVGTLIMYLNNPVSGGGTTFPDAGLEVLPQRGHAVFFSYDRPSPATRTLHGGAPVVEGDKWIATKWLRESSFT
jgi:prolyl 4-hydroxylase